MVKLVGIINLTPDSFSDGGMLASTDHAVAYANELVEAGAAVLDIGAESTRPGATPLSAEEEWARLHAPLAAICSAVKGRAVISVDTRHAATAKNALALGVEWINDVSGLADAAMLAVLSDSECNIVAMHSLTVPADANVILPEGKDPIEAVLEYAETLSARLAQAGIARERLILDPGIGFGKTPEQLLELLRRIDELAAAGYPLFVGHSRKSFLKAFTGGKPELRDAATLAVSLVLARRKVDYLRVHDVAAHTAALAAAEAFA